MHCPFPSTFYVTILCESTDKAPSTVSPNKLEGTARPSAPLFTGELVAARSASAVEGGDEVLELAAEAEGDSLELDVEAIEVVFADVVLVPAAAFFGCTRVMSMLETLLA